MGKVKTVIGKYKWWIFGGVFLYPFYCLLIGEILNIGELYTFRLPLRDFITAWIALGGIIGVVSNIRLTQKRMTEQQKQFDTQIEKQNEQIKNQRKQLSDTRFSSGVELLGNPNESARIGGAYNLYFLASEYPDEYLNPVCEILCSHIRTITGNNDYREKYKEKPSNEIQTFLNLLFSESYKKNDKLIFNECNKNLVGTFFGGVSFGYFDAKLNNVDFSEAELSYIGFRAAELCNVSFCSAKLNNVGFPISKLNKTYFWRAELSNVNFFSTKIREFTFMEAELSNVDFWDAELNNIDNSLYESTAFASTSLEGCSYDEITKKESSLELTKNKSADENTLTKKNSKTKKNKKQTDNLMDGNLAEINLIIDSKMPNA